MRHLFNYLNPFKQKSIQAPPPTEEELAQFSLQIHDICDKVKVRNLKLVSNTIESTSGHNNHHLVKAAVYFVKECVWVFNTEYASDYSSADYFNEFIVYIREVQNDFENRHYDPDGVAGGTVTDIVLKITDLSTMNT